MLVVTALNPAPDVNNKIFSPLGLAHISAVESKGWYIS